MKRNVQVKPYISKRSRKSSSRIIEEPITNITAGTPYNDNITDVKCTYHLLPKQLVSLSNHHSNVISSLRWHPLQKFLFLSSSFDKSVVIWNISRKTLFQSNHIKVHDEAVKNAAWNHNGTTILTASLDKSAKLIDVSTGHECGKFPHADRVTTIAFHPKDNQLFLSGTSTDGVYAWDSRQNNFIRNYSTHFGEVQDLLFLPGGEQFVSSAQFTKKNSLDKTITVWDFESSAILSNHIYQEPYTCSQLKMHPNQKSFLAQSAAGYIAIFDALSPWKLNKYKRYEGHQSGGYHIGFDVAASGKYIYCGDSDGYMYCYDAYTSRVKEKLKVFHTAHVKVACNEFHPSMLLCGSWDGKIALWE